MRRLSFLCILCLTSCQVDLSWKQAVFELDDRDKVFDAVRDVVSQYFHGVSVNEDREAGRIETDYIYRMGSDPVLREKAWFNIDTVKVDSGNVDSGNVDTLGGRIRVEVLVIIEEGDIDVDATDGLYWKKLGSDVKVEKILLDSIIQKVGRLGLGRQRGEFVETSERPDSD